jgi:hypothetical protein
VEAEWSAYRLLEGNPEKGITLGTPRNRRDAIKINLKEVARAGVDCLSCSG